MAKDALNSSSTLPNAPLQAGSFERDDEIDFIEFWRTLWQHRRLIFSVALLAGLLGAGNSMLMPSVYQAESIIVPAPESGVKGGGGIPSALGGLASLAGVSLGGDSETEKNLAVLRSREFLWAFFKENNVAEAISGSEDMSEWDVYRWFSRHLSVVYSKKTSLVTVSFECESPELAAQWVNALIVKLNRYLKDREIERAKKSLGYLHQELARTQVEAMRMVLYQLVAQEQQKAMMANTQEEFAFRVLDHASVPDERISPKRKLITIFSTLAGLIAGVVFVFLRRVFYRISREV